MYLKGIKTPSNSFSINGKKLFMQSIFEKILRHPIIFLKRIFGKAIYQRIKYQRNDGYDAENYWKDRLNKYADSLLGPGDEGLSETDNKKIYAIKTKRFVELLGKYKISLNGAKVLEIGCGNGSFTEVISTQGASNATCVDITDILFPDLSKKYSNYIFKKLDISREALNDKYDVIIMIDVVQHIVADDKFLFAMKNIQNALNKNGFLIIAPINYKETKSMFHVHFRTADAFEKALSDISFFNLEFFYNNQILIGIKNN